MAYYNSKVYRAQGGGSLVVANGGSIQIMTGGSLLPNSGSKAAYIADLATNVSLTTTAVAAINGLKTALVNLGAMATS